MASLSAPANDPTIRLGRGWSWQRVLTSHRPSQASRGSVRNDQADLSPVDLRIHRSLQDYSEAISPGVFAKSPTKVRIRLQSRDYRGCHRLRVCPGGWHSVYWVYVRENRFSSLARVGSGVRLPSGPQRVSPGQPPYSSIVTALREGSKSVWVITGSSSGGRAARAHVYEAF
jgi:hypothetical protein